MQSVAGSRSRPPEPKWREFELVRNVIEAREVERTAHTVTQVGGYLYFLGGRENRRPKETRFCSILSLEDFTWQYLKVPRTLDGRPKFCLQGHTATLVNDQIWFIGGVLGLAELDYSDLVFSLDLVEEQFVCLKCLGHGEVDGFFLHTADFYQERNEIIVFGGYNPYGRVNFYPLHSLNTITLNWTEMVWRGQAPGERRNHASCLVRSELYIFGGLTAAAVVLNDLYVLNLASSTPTFSEVRTRYSPERRFGTLLFHFQGHLFLFGGKRRLYEGANIRQNDMNRFDLREQEWHECENWSTQTRPSARCNHKAAILESSVLIFGGTRKSICSLLELYF